MGVIVGVDLGTTNSCVAVVRDGRPKVIEDERGYNILPSCIAMKGRGRFVVGHGAKAMILTKPQETLYAVKRLIGRKFHSAEVQEAAKNVSFEVAEGENGSVLLRMGEIELTPVEASSIILKAVKEIAEKATGETVTDAVITVPANFTHAQRKATMESGEKAGLNVLRLLNEPTAAALAYGFKKDIQKKIAVFDLGGGTFDVSVLEVGEGVYEILGTAGNSFLGGEDFDYRIVSWLADSFQQQTGTDPRQDKEALQRLKDAAERAKCELSFVDKTPILIPRLHGEHNLEMELTRAQLEEMVQDLVNETIKITDSALRSANMSIEDLDEIILVGGMTRMPKVQETIKVFFGMNPCKGVHPEEVVAIGASVHGFNLESETRSTLLLDVTPFSLGVDTAGGFFKPIIERNATVPCSESRTFTTVKDGQSEVKIVVRQGESKLAAENEFLGEFVLQGVREAEKMVPRIDVSFRIDSSGILHVSAVDRDTSEAQTIEIREYLEAASQAESKAVVLASNDVDTGAAAPPHPAPAAGKAEEKKGRLSRFARMAGFGKKKQAAASSSGKAAAGEHAVQERVAQAPTDVQDRSQAAAPASASEPSGADPFAVADRAASPAGASGGLPPTEDAIPTLNEAAVESVDGPGGMVEAPSDEVFDPFGVVSRDDVTATFGGGLPVGTDVLDEVEGEFDPFGITERQVIAEETNSTGGGGISLSSPLDSNGAGADSKPKDAGGKKPAKKRRPARLRISYKKASTFLAEYRRNLKRGGTFIKTPKPLDVGRDCVLHLTIPGWDDPLELRGSVVWSSKGVEVMAGQEEGMGIKYDPKDTQGHERLEEILGQLDAGAGA